MSSQTRWPAQANTNEMVDVMLSWEFAGAADLTRTPMVVRGVNESAAIQGTAVRAVTRIGPGIFEIALKEPFPWLLGHSLSVGTPAADAAAPFVVKVATDQAAYQSASAPLVIFKITDPATGLPADPPVGHTLWGSLMFRNRQTGSLCRGS